MKTITLFLTALCSCLVFASGIEAHRQQRQLSLPISAHDLVSSAMFTDDQSASASTDVFEIPASIRVSPGTKALIEACLGEPVTILGNAVLVVHRTTLPGGYTVLLIHANPQGAVALGGLSGETYHFAASDTLAQVIAPSGTFVGTFVANLHVIGSDDSSGFFGHILLHVCVTPAGEVTADIEIIDSECM